MTKGRFICIEGIDGAGKTTQAQRLLNRMPEAVTFREPGGTAAGEEIRNLLLNRRDVPLNERTEVMLFMAARAQLMVEIIATLERGITVVMDRWSFSTFAYQHGINKQEWEAMTEYVGQGYWPDVVIWLDLPVEAARARKDEGARADRYEVRGDDYYRITQERYKHLSMTMPWFKRIDATQPQSVIEEVIWTFVNRE